MPKVTLLPSERLVLLQVFHIGPRHKHRADIGLVKLCVSYLCGRVGKREGGHAGSAIERNYQRRTVNVSAVFQRTLVLLHCLP